MESDSSGAAFASVSSVAMNRTQSERLFVSLNSWLWFLESLIR